MSPSARELLLHILDETDYLLAAFVQVKQDEFLADPTLKRAFARSLEIIGEAVKSLPFELTDAQPQVDWQSIARMRNRLIHHYFGIDYEMVWGVVTSKVEDYGASDLALIVRRQGPMNSGIAQPAIDTQRSIITPATCPRAHEESSASRRALVLTISLGTDSFPAQV